MLGLPSILGLEVLLPSLTLHIYYTQGFRILQELLLLIFRLVAGVGIGPT